MPLVVCVVGRMRGKGKTAFRGVHNSLAFSGYH